MEQNLFCGKMARRLRLVNFLKTLVLLFKAFTTILIARSRLNPHPVYAVASWIRCSAMITSAWWLRTSNKVSGNKVETTPKNIASLETLNQVQIPSNIKYNNYLNGKCTDHSIISVRVRRCPATGR